MPIAKPQTAKSTPSERARKTRLLVVDDNADQRLVIKQAIRQTFEQVELILMTTPEEVLAYLQDCLQTASGYPQLMVLDLYLPSREIGMRLLEQIRTLSEPVCHLPIMMLSSSAEKQDVQDAYERGINTYVVKPDSFDHWLAYFGAIKEYWWETVDLPRMRYV